MRQPLTSRPPYGEGRPRTPTAEAELPEGEPAERGLPVDESVPGTKTFVKPLDEQVEHPKRDETILRVRNPRDMAKTRDRVDDVDLSKSGPGYMGLGKPHLSPKTKYPYRDGKPNTHNAAFVAGLWAVERAPQRLLRAGFKTVVAAPIGALRDGLNPKTVERAQSCAVTLKRADVKNLRWIFSVDCGNGPKVVKFKADRAGNITKFHKMDFHIACSCPAWRWQGPEFHSTTKDFQDPKVPLQGTATPPDIRDPERHNMVCKHVAAVLNLTKDWTIPKSKVQRKKKATEQLRQVEKLFETLGEPLAAASRLVSYGWQKASDEKKERLAQEVARAAAPLHDMLFFEFEDPAYGKAIKSKLRKITNFKKMLLAWSKVRSWAELEALLKKQETRSKTVWEKVYEYKQFVLGVVASLDIEPEDTFHFDNYTVTMLTSPRGDWDQAKVEALKEVLQRTNRTLAARGLSKATGGRVFAYPGRTLPAASSSGSALASYSIKDDIIRLAANEDVAKVHKSMVHELGHRAYYRLIGGRGRTAWEQFFGENVKPLNIDALLSNWQRHWQEPKDWSDRQYGKFLFHYIDKVADPEEKMWLNLIANKLDIKEDIGARGPKKGTVPGFDQIKSSKDEIEVFLHPVTAYSGTNPSELFAETFAHYAIQGPGRIPEIVRHAFQQALPQFKTGHQQDQME